MAETKNIADIAERISAEIFRHFHWQAHPKHDDNFPCVNPAHKSSSGASKGSHPGDVVFYYIDPYLQKRVYLHTDLKSYTEASITPSRLKDAFQSLCMSIECAKQSKHWRQKYSVDTSTAHEVRGLLFVHNYTKGYEKNFHDAVAQVKLQKMPIEPGTLLHFLGPHDIRRLYNVGNDLIRLKHDGVLPDEYTFYYPDLVMFRRHGDVWGQAATIESLTGPYIIIKHGAAKKSEAGYLIYFNQRGELSPQSLEYFIDSLSRYQMLESGEKIRVRCTGADDEDMRSKFETAKQRYAKAWSFESSRTAVLNAIEISTVVGMVDTYNPGTTGWRE